MSDNTAAEDTEYHWWITVDLPGSARTTKSGVYGPTEPLTRDEMFSLVVDHVSGQVSATLGVANLVVVAFDVQPNQIGGAR